MKKHGLLWWLFIGWWWRLYVIPFRLLRALIRQAKAGTPAPSESAQKKETVKVAGVSFRQDEIMFLGVKNSDYTKTKKELREEGLTGKWIHEYNFDPQKVELQPEPDNPVSSTAIKVIVDGVHIGYIKDEDSDHINDLIDENRITRISCFIGGGKSKKVSWDAEEEVFTAEKDEIVFYARPTITTK